MLKGILQRAMFFSALLCFSLGLGANVAAQPVSNQHVPNLHEPSPLRVVATQEMPAPSQGSLIQSGQFRGSGAPPEEIDPFESNNTSAWPQGPSYSAEGECLPGNGAGNLNQLQMSPSFGEGVIEEKHWFLQQMELRSSKTHGRAMGPGTPLRGTSWRNRPYEVTFETGAMLMAQRVAENVRKEHDYFAAVQLGWDWDHYWGSQVRIGWSTPQLVNTTQAAPSKAQNFFITDASCLYYPWGDSRLRPYYRLGVGLTNLEYIDDQGTQNNASLFTVPFGVGFKYQTRRNLAVRFEFMDNLAIGMNDTSTLNNLTLTGGLEWRFGGRSTTHWSWARRGGAL